MFQILSTKTLPERVHNFLAAHGTVNYWPGNQPLNADNLVNFAPDVDAIMTTSLRIDADILRRLPKLKVVSTTSVGYDHFDTAAMKEYGVIGTHTPTVLDETVADLTFALMLSTARRVVELDAVVRSGNWKSLKEQQLFGCDVHHKTIGIIGMGRIGQAVAHRAKFGFSMNVLYHNRSQKPEVEEATGARYVALDELLSESDFVVLLTPLTEQTRGLMNQEAFAKMKPEAIFINVSRGATVDETALYEALKSGQIQGAGLDVFVEEPVSKDNPLLTLDNVVVLPHIGSATRETRDAMAMLAAENAVHVLEGRPQQARIVPELKSLVKGNA